MKKSRLVGIIPYVITALMIVSLFTYTKASRTKTLDYGAFEKVIQTKSINKVTLTMNSTVIDISGTYTENNTEYIFLASVPNTETQNNRLMELLRSRVKDAAITIKNPYQTNYLMETLAQLVPLMLLVGFGIYMINRMNAGGNAKAFEFSKSRARLEGNIKVSFDDVAGCEEEKEEMA